MKAYIVHFNRKSLSMVDVLAHGLGVVFTFGLWLPFAIVAMARSFAEGIWVEERETKQ